MGDYNRRVQVVVHRIVAFAAQILHIYSRNVGGFQLHQMIISVHQTFQPLFGSLQGFVAEVYRAAVVSLEDEEADGHRRICLAQHLVVTSKKFLQRDEVAQ